MTDLPNLPEVESSRSSSTILSWLFICGISPLNLRLNALDDQKRKTLDKLIRERGDLDGDLWEELVKERDAARSENAALTKRLAELQAAIHGEQEWTVLHAPDCAVEMPTAQDSCAKAKATRERLERYIATVAEKNQQLTAITAALDRAGVPMQPEKLPTGGYCQGCYKSHETYYCPDRPFGTEGKPFPAPAARIDALAAERDGLKRATYNARQNLLDRAALYRQANGEPGPLGATWGWRDIAKTLRDEAAKLAAVEEKADG